MKKLFKVLGYLFLVVVLIIGGLVTYVKTALPNVGAAPELKVDRTSARIERGRYLANNVVLCMDCHSTRDWSKFAGPMIEGTQGKGGETFDQKFGFPGKFYSRNITPAGISRYTDGELYRVITTGVTKEGQALFPIMPYPYYGKMDPEDIYSIIAYVRTLQPIQSSIPERVPDFPMNIILNTIPAKAVGGKRPDDTSSLQYGAYMVNASACMECHTKADKGQIIPELAFSGGREFILPDGSTVRSANITPDMNTGIGAWSEEAFVNRFKSYTDSAYKPQKIGKGDFNTIMPWNMYGRMSRQDLAAIYRYLRTLQPQQNQVVKFTSANEVVKK